MMQSSGTTSWDTARQFAVNLASGGVAEANPDPVERIQLEELVRVAELRVGDVTGLPIARTGGILRVVPVTRSEWARRTIDGWRPLLERPRNGLKNRPSSATPPADAKKGGAPPPPPDSTDPGGLTALPSPGASPVPVRAASCSPSVACRPVRWWATLAGRALGQYDLPIPRPLSDELIVVAPERPRQFVRRLGSPARRSAPLAVRVRARHPRRARCAPRPGGARRAPPGLRRRFLGSTRKRPPSRSGLGDLDPSDLRHAGGSCVIRRRPAGVPS